MAAALRFEPKKSTVKPRRVDLPLLNSTDQAVIATDLSGKVVFWNQVAERMYGWKWHEAVGQPITKLVVPKSAQPVAAKIMEQLRDGKSWTGQFQLRRRDGTEFTAMVTDHPMQDNKGNLIGIIGMSRPEPDK